MKIRPKYLLTLLAMTFLGMVILQCTDQLPSEYKSKTYDFPQRITDVCEYITRDTVAYDTTMVIDTTNGGSDTTYNVTSDSFYFPVSSISFEDIITPDWIQAHRTEIIDLLQLNPDSSNEYILDSLFAAGHTPIIKVFSDTLTSLLNSIQTDTTLVIHNPAGYDTSYVLFNQSQASSVMLELFFSWDFTPDNLDDYITIDMLNIDGEKISMQPIYDLVDIAGCGEHVRYESENIDKMVPKIQTSAQTMLSPGEYFLRLVVSSPADIRTIHALLLDQ